MSSDDGFEENLALINLSDAVLVDSVGAGWAETLGEDGSKPEGVPEHIFMLTVDHFRPGELREGKVEAHKMYLAFSPNALDDLVLTLAKAIMSEDERGERGDTHEQGASN